MLSIEPQTDFGIVRQINDPADTDTYYVQAEIRKANTDELITTVNLIDRGDRRFSNVWQAIADVSGQGLYISIVTKVYTDSGYSTQSTNYGEEENTYVIRRNVKSLGGHSVGGGLDMTPKMLKKLIEGVVNGAIKTIPKAPKIPEMKETNLDGVFEGIQNIAMRPQFEKTDLSELSGLLKDVKGMLEKIPTKPQDLSTINDSLDIVKNSVNDRMDDSNKRREMISGDTVQRVEAAVSSISEMLKGIEKAVNNREVNSVQLSLGNASGTKKEGSNNNRANRLRR